MQLFFILFNVFLLQTSIYDLTVNDSQGNQIHFSDFKGKKILIVNTASNSKYASQYNDLEQLYQKFKDSLVVIAFPSNDFNNEPGDSVSSVSVVISKYHISYIFGSPLAVKGSDISPLFKWLSESAQNGAINSPVIGDFCKYLIDGNGNIIGVFSGEVDPMEAVIQDAITTNYN